MPERASFFGPHCLVRGVLLMCNFRRIVEVGLSLEPELQTIK